MLVFKLAALTLALSSEWVAAVRLPTSLAFQSRQQESQSSAANGVNLAAVYPAYNLSVPVDHFHNDSQYAPHSDAKFPLRYWFDATYYKPGGPVIVLAGGETNGQGRLPFLQKGIVAQLANATNGLGVILEHRYYGASLPTTFTVQNLRFLTTDQALADSAYFAKNVVFKGLEKYNLTAPQTKWIVYGGSYAGGFAAFLRKLYPDIFFGGISSSGVTDAIWDYWQYYEPIRKYAPKDCVSVTQQVVNITDNIYYHNSTYVADLKKFFGLGSVSSFPSFAYTLSYGLLGWQSRNWDPAIDDPSTFEFCGNVSSSKLLFNPTADQKAQARKLIAAGGHAADTEKFLPYFLNFMGYSTQTFLATSASEIKARGLTADQYFSPFGTLEQFAPSSGAAAADLDPSRAWPWQYCTQWGYLQTGSGTPPDIQPIVSRTVDLNYSSQVCRGVFGLTQPANTTAINKYGAKTISYPRLAHIAGQTDPWRPASALAEEQPQPPSTPSEPRIVIEGAVHHWDENGLFPNETTATLPPAPVRDAQKQMREFVVAWLKET